MKLKTADIAILGISFAIIIIFTFVPIPLPVTIALPLIPVFVLCQNKGFKTGVIAGLGYGIFSMINAFTISPSVLREAFQNPLISVLPRFIMAAVCALTYDAMKKRAKSKAGQAAASVVSSLAGAVTNTVLVLGLILLLFNNKTMAYEGKSVTVNFGWVLAAVAAVNSVIEIVVFPMLVMPITAALNRAWPRATDK